MYIYISMTSRPFIHRQVAKQRPSTSNRQRPYIICSPEGCAVIRNPKHVPKQPTTYLTPDYDSDDYHYDDCWQHLENSRTRNQQNDKHDHREDL